MRGVDSALQFAVSYHNFVYFFCRQFMLNPDIIPELVVSGIFINFFGGGVGGVRHHIFFCTVWFACFTIGSADHSTRAS